MNLADKVILVTGATSGIGRVTAESFGTHGTFLAITRKNQANLDEVEKACRKNGAKDVLQINVDFSDLANVKIIAEKVEAKFERLDILINNAGMGMISQLADVTEEHFDRHFAVNVKSLLFLTHKAMPVLVETKGCVVNVSSVFSVECVPFMLVYSMTKAAIDYLTKTIALEYAPTGVRINNVNLGLVRTSIMHRSVPNEITDQIYVEAVKDHPLGRVGTVDDVVKSIMFLASENSSLTTGHCLMVDGGRRVRTAN